MSNPIQDAETRASRIIGEAKIEAARLRRQATEMLEDASRQKDEAALLMAKAKAGMEDLRRESAARGI